MHQPHVLNLDLLSTAARPTYFMCEYVCVPMFLCVCVWIHVCMRPCVHVYRVFCWKSCLLCRGSDIENKYIHASTFHICMYVCIYMYTYIYIYTYIHTYKLWVWSLCQCQVTVPLVRCIYTYIHTYIHTYICTYIHTYTLRCTDAEAHTHRW